jgi:hypothetical protein
VSAEDDPGSLGAIDASQIALDPVRVNNRSRSQIFDSTLLASHEWDQRD